MSTSGCSIFKAGCGSSRFKLEWIVGKAQGELPWFGLFKLWITGHDSRAFPPSSVQNLIVTVIILVVVPIAMDLLSHDGRKRRDQEGSPEEGKKLRFQMSLCCEEE